MIRPVELPRNLVGYYDDENFYFESDAAYAAVIKSCYDVGEHFPLTQKALAFDQMIDFLADMIEKYGDKIPKDDIEIRSKKTA